MNDNTFDDFDTNPVPVVSNRPVTANPASTPAARQPQSPMAGGYMSAGDFQQRAREHWQLVPVDDVIVRERQREVNSEHVRAIRQSFRSLDGQVQIQPIVLTDELVLIDGAHRLAAAKAEGWSHISALVFPEVSEAMRQRIEAEANIVRLQLSPVEMEETWRKIYRPYLLAESERNKARALEENRHNAPKTVEEFYAERTELDLSEGTENEDPEGENEDFTVVRNSYYSKSGSIYEKSKEILGVSADTLNKVAELREAQTDTSLPLRVREAAVSAIERLKRPGAKVENEWKKFQLIRQTVQAQLSRPQQDPAQVRREKARDMVERLVQALGGAVSRVDRQRDEIVDAAGMLPTMKLTMTSARNSAGQLMAMLLMLEARSRGLSSEGVAALMDEAMAHITAHLRKTAEKLDTKGEEKGDGVEAE